MGRRKVEMKKITNTSSRLVTFSKRRTGLFKKANEICTLCAVEIAIIVFSIGGKPFSFGQPNFEKVVRQYRRRSHNQYPNGSTSSESKSEKANIRKFSQELINLEAQIEEEKKKSLALQEEAHKPVDELNLTQLIELEKRLQDLSRVSTRRVNELKASSALLLLANSAALK